MLAKFFDMPVQTNGSFSALSDCHLFDTNRIISYSYTKRFAKSGEFALTLPFLPELLSALKINGILTIDGDWLWIQDIAYNGQTISVSGKDCKGFLESRISLYSDPQHVGTDGYDVATGTTAQCIKHYLDNNCIGLTGNAAARNLPISWAGGASGTANDSYMARLEYLSDVVTKLCEDAEIGYDITFSQAAGGLVFVTLAGTDRSRGQSVNPRVIFSLRHRNIISQSSEHGVSDLLNVIYCTDPDGYTGKAKRDSTEAAGLARRECNVGVSVGISDPLFEKYGLQEVVDNTETHSFTVSPAYVDAYGTEYELGDIVTLLDDYTSDFYNVRITEASKEYSAGEKKLSLTFGKSKQKVFQKLVNGFLSGTAKRR